MELNDKKHLFDFLSADEQKLSALILCTFGLAGLAGYECVTAGDIPGNLKDLIETFALCIAGINAAGKFSNVIKKE